MEGLALASLMVDSKHAQYAVASASNHNSASEKQYRYLTEYGGQKPPYAQWTVTVSGAALVAQSGQGSQALL